MRACKLVLMQIATSILLVIFLSTGIETEFITKPTIFIHL